MSKSFRILLEVEAHALGPVMNILQRTDGVLRFDPLLDRKPPPVTKKNGAANGKARYTGDETAEQLIIKSLAKKSPIKSTAFPDIFVKAGRAPTSPTYALHAAKKAGLIQIGPDGYTLTKRGRDKARYV